MPGHRRNMLDAPLDAMAQALDNADQHLANMSQGVADFDSQELSPQEDELLFDNPSLRYLGQPEPTTGLPYTNAQAAARLLQELGPEEYVSYVEDVVRRRDRRAAQQQEVPDANLG